MQIINYCDIKNSWSVGFIIRTREGRGIYTYEKGVYVKRDREPLQRMSWNWGHRPKKVYYLTDDEAERINAMNTEARRLDQAANNIRCEISKIIGSNIKVS